MSNKLKLTAFILAFGVAFGGWLVGLVDYAIPGAEAQAPPIPIVNGGTGTASLPTGALKGAGTAALTQAACGDLSNAAASCSTDATNASNLASGTVPPARLGSGTPTVSTCLLGNSTWGSCGGGASGVSRLTTQLGPVGNGADTTEDTLLTFAMTAGQLATNGQAVHIRAIGTISATSATTKTIRVYFGATVIGTLSTTGTSAPVWYMDATVWRTGATSQFSGSLMAYGLNGTASTATPIGGASPAETLSGAVTIKVTGQSTTATANICNANALEVDFAP